MKGLKARLSLIISGLVSQRSGMSSSACSKQLSTVRLVLFISGAISHASHSIIARVVCFRLLTSGNCIARSNDRSVRWDVATSDLNTISSSHTNTASRDHGMKTKSLVDNRVEIREVLQGIEIRTPIVGLDFCTQLTLDGRVSGQVLEDK